MIESAQTYIYNFLSLIFTLQHFFVFCKYTSVHGVIFLFIYFLLSKPFQNSAKFSSFTFDLKVKRWGGSRLLGGTSRPQGVPVITYSVSEALCVFSVHVMSADFSLCYFSPFPIHWFCRDGFSTSQHLILNWNQPVRPAGQQNGQVKKISFFLMFNNL